MTKHGMYGTPEYQAYRNAYNRCVRRADPRFHCYGGRGVQFKFKSFEEFYEDIGPRPSKDHSLDRIDVCGNYEVGNVRWATRQQQARNKRTTRRLTVGGKTKTLKEWSAETGIPYKRIWRRINDGWSPEDAIKERRNGGTLADVVNMDRDVPFRGWIG